MQELSPYFINRIPPEVPSDFSTSAKGYTQDEPHFREYWRIITKRWRLIVTLVICSLVITSVVVFLMTPTYTATSQVLIEPQQVLDMRALETQEPGDDAQNNYYGTQYKILQSRSLAARVIRELNLQNEPFLRPKKPDALEARLLAEGALTKDPKDPIDSVDSVNSKDPVDDKDLVDQDGDPDAGTEGVRPRVIDAYLKRLTIRPEPGTSLVTVAFSAPNPVLSARIVNAHVQAYIARGTELHAEASETAVKYLQAKLTELQGRVEKSEANLNAYRRQRGIVTDSSTDDDNTPEDNNRVVMNRLVDLNRALTDAETQRITLEAEAHLISTHDYDALPAIQTDEVIQNFRQEEARIQAEYAGLAEQYKPSYPPLAELAAKLKEIQFRLNDEVHRVAMGIKLGYDAALEREKDLTDQINQEKNVALSLNDASLQDAILSRAVDTNRKLYKNVLERMTQMGVAAGVSSSNVSILDSATPPLVPSSPKILLSLASCTILALLIGISIACFLERFDDTFKDSDEIEHYLGVPNLAIVPDFRKLSRPTNGPKGYLSSRLGSAQIKATNAVIVADQDNGFSPATEAYRALRLGLLLSQAGESPKVILITSGTPGEGKTVTAINTGIAFAQMGSKVLLIDADLRSSRCHKLLAMTNRGGLTEVLTGQQRPDELIRPTSVDGLECLTSGSTPPNPGRLLSSEAMATLLLNLRANYDCILIDSAPVMPVTDALHLMAMVDGVLLVVGPHIPKQRVRHVCARLKQIHAPLLGVVQNQVDINTHRNAGDYYYPRFYKSQDLDDAYNLVES
ncbi:MAG TPA: polysaccharide biosynthesis tyrosine autokinase [Candidatus Binataceae bacterium]|nr:polysaccharide biosynthesis tyrosine autokinase [Candidatus Binataceae bacterium]